MRSNFPRSAVCAICRKSSKFKSDSRQEIITCRQLLEGTGLTMHQAVRLALQHRNPSIDRSIPEMLPSLRPSRRLESFVMFPSRKISAPGLPTQKSTRLLVGCGTWGSRAFIAAIGSSKKEPPSSGDAMRYDTLLRVATLHYMITNTSPPGRVGIRPEC